MEIRELRYFLAVAREENITRAAESLHIAQPSLSRQMMELEARLGKQLLVRGKRKTTLTEEGELLRSRAEEILALVDKTEQDIAADTSALVGSIAIGGSTPTSVLAAAASLRAAHPGVQFNFYSGDAVDVTARLDHGSLDFAVMLSPIDSSLYDFLTLPECSEWGVLLKASDALADKAVLTPDVLLPLPLIMHGRLGLQSDLAHWAGTSLEALHIAATYNIVHGSPAPFVEQGLGVLLTTRDLLTEVLPDTLHFLPLSPSLTTQHALVWKKHTRFSKPAAAFLATMKQSLQKA